MAGANSPTPELQARAAELLANSKLRNVRVLSCSATLSADDHRRPPGNVVVNIAPAFALGAGSYVNKFDYEVTLTDPNDLPIAQFNFSLAVDYEIFNPSFEPEQDAAEFVATTTGFFAAFPYARELLQSLSARLQLNPLVFDFLDRDHLSPRGVSVVAPSQPALEAEQAHSTDADE